MLPRPQRIRAQREFTRIFGKGRAIPGSALFLKWNANLLGHPRFGIVVSNKVAKRAVVRNKLKRRLREIIKALLKQHPIAGLAVDVVVITRPIASTLTYQQLQEIVRGLFDRITPPNSSRT